MTLTELTSIISTADQKTITSRLKELGYIDCKKHEQYKHIKLTDIFLGNDIETNEYPNPKGTRRYQGGIFTQVKGYEQMEFILINMNDNKNVFPIDMLIWAKVLDNTSV